MQNSPKPEIFHHKVFLGQGINALVKITLGDIPRLARRARQGSIKPNPQLRIDNELEC